MALHGGESLSESALDEKDKKKKRKSKGAPASKGSAVAGGALSGAAAGTAIAPGIGTAIGAGVGAAASLIQSNQTDKETGPRPKRRKLSKFLGTFEKQKQRRVGGLIALSQAVSDFAANVR